MVSKKNKYVIVRSNMGVHAGELDEKQSTNDKKVFLNARRLWRWYSPGAGLSEIAIEGPVNHSECKFSPPVSFTELTSPTNGFEVIDVTPEARKVIEGVPAWRA